jgi:AcrR family transcriptional regulator
MNVETIAKDPDATAAPERELPIRDRVQTQGRIFQAGRALLAEGGFQAFGVNAVARRAGCDKQLIYRYFGGLDGLVDAIGEDLAGWVTKHVPEDQGGRFMLTYGDLMERLVELYADALRADPLMRRILVWELSESSPHIARMAEARAKGIAQWIERMRGSLTPPKGSDPVALNAVVIAAVQQLVLAAETSGSFAGLPLKSQKDWARAIAAVSRVARGAYA